MPQRNLLVRGRGELWVGGTLPGFVQTRGTGSSRGAKGTLSLRCSTAAFRDASKTSGL